MKNPDQHRANWTKLESCRTGEGAQAGGEEQPHEPPHYGVQQQVSLKRREHGFHCRIARHDQKARVFQRRRSRHYRSFPTHHRRRREEEVPQW